MPLLNPNQINNLLAETGIVQKQPENQSELVSILNGNGLSIQECVDCVGSVCRGADSAITRLKAAEMGLRMHRVLDNKETAVTPSVTIIINDPDSAIVNPILIPR